MQTYLPTQTEPVSCNLTVLVWDVEIIWIIAERPSHRDGLTAFVLAAAISRPTGIANLDAQIWLSAGAVIVVAVSDRPSGRAVRILLVARLAGSGLGACRPREIPSCPLRRSGDSSADDRRERLATTGSRKTRTTEPRSPIRWPERRRSGKNEAAAQRSRDRGQLRKAHEDFSLSDPIGRSVAVAFGHLRTAARSRFRGRPAG